MVDEIETQPGFEDASPADDVFTIFAVILAIVRHLVPDRHLLGLFVLRAVERRADPAGHLVRDDDRGQPDLIASVVSALPLIGAIAVIVLLFTGGAGPWFRRRRRLLRHPRDAAVLAATGPLTAGFVIECRHE